MISTVLFDGYKRSVEFKEVLFVPALICNLLSVRKLRKAGFRVVFDGDERGKGFCAIVDKIRDVTVALAIERDEGLYEILLRPILNTKALLTSLDTERLWHQRMGHIRNGTVRKTSPSVKFIPFQSTSDESKCEECLKGKSTRLTRPSASSEDSMVTNPLELVHSDVKGPFETLSNGRAKYLLTLYHDSSALSLVRFLKNRSEVNELLKGMITELETVRGGKVRRFHFDNAGNTFPRRRKTG